MARQKNRIKSQLCYLGIEIPVEYLEPYSNWSKRFLNWLKQVAMRTPSGRQAMDILIMQFSGIVPHGTLRGDLEQAFTSV